MAARILLWLAALSALIATTVAKKDLGPLVHELCPEWGQIATECYTKQLNDIIAGISQGIPSLGLPSMDPLVTGAVNVSIHAATDQALMLSFHSLNFTGLSKTRVSDIKVGNPLQLTLHLPKLRMRTPYTNEGRLVLLRATGGGHLTFTFVDVTMQLHLQYDTEERDGQRFATVDAAKVKVNAKRANIHVDRLDNNNELARQLYNVFLTASSQEIFNVLLPHINRKFSELFLDVARQTTANLPLTSVFSPWVEPPSV